MGTRWLLPLWVFLLTVKVVFADDGPIVETPLGKVQGHTLTSRSGRQFMAFSGVPYAKPPVGELRFQPPQPLNQWKGIKQAKHDGPYCIQANPFVPGGRALTSGVEDCLYLSLYTHNATRKAPVLVFYHGGDFIIGNGEWTKPTLMMDEDILIVNVNYRLGIFGFLTFETKELPGNQGMKDQTLALRWVQQNIESFGGDPNKVTITGCSAGGASVYHHYVSPLSRGLFHQGLSSSGSSYNPWALSPPGLAKANAEKLMTLIGCPTSPSEGIPCAMKKNATEIVEKFSHFIVFGFDPMLTFSPSLEEPGPGAFLEAPVSKWEHNPVPLIILVSSAEGTFRVDVMKESGTKEYSDNFEKLAPISLHYWASASHPDQVTKKVWEFYFPGKKEITFADDRVNLTHLYSDVGFNHGIMKGADKAKGNVYFLYFDYIVKAAIPPGADEKDLIGANHCGELSLMWTLDVPGMPKNINLTEKELKISQELVKMVADFMKSGAPDIPGSDLKWKPWTSEHNNYVQLDNTGYTQKEGLLQERFKFWDTVNYQDRFDVKSH